MPPLRAGNFRRFTAGALEESGARRRPGPGLKPVIDKRYAFEELPQALDHLYRGPFGKVVIEF